MPFSPCLAASLCCSRLLPGCPPRTTTKSRSTAPNWCAGATMVELHSNYTTRSGVTGPAVLDLSRAARDGRDHPRLQRLLRDWVTTSSRRSSRRRLQWVGNHIRPRFAVPARWHWPVGVCFSQEIGYQRQEFSPDTWTWEFRPIIDKTIGPVLLGGQPGARLRRSTGRTRGRASNSRPT